MDKGRERSWCNFALYNFIEARVPEQTVLNTRLIDVDVQNEISEIRAGRGKS